MSKRIMSAEQRLRKNRLEKKRKVEKRTGKLRKNYVILEYGYLHCSGAIHWTAERKIGSRSSAPKVHDLCSSYSAKITDALNTFPDPPPLLLDLLNSDKFDI